MRAAIKGSSAVLAKLRVNMQRNRQECDCLVDGFLPSLRIISYHSISDLAGSTIANYGLPLEQFERQINILVKSGYSFFDPAHLIDFVTGRLQIESDCILITFDDCYKD